MPPTEVFAQVTHSPRWALSVTDALKRALRTGGEFPPPLGDVACEIVAQITPTAQVFDPPLVLRTVRARSGYLVLDGTWTRERPGQADRVVPLPLGAGKYRVRVSGDYYQALEFRLQWPLAEGQARITPLDAQDNPTVVDLLPGSAYPLPDVTTTRMQLGPTILRGTLFTSSGDPIAGVLVEAINFVFQQPQELPPLGPWPFLQARTDARGDWAILLPGRRYFDNAPELQLPNTTIVRPIAIRFHLPNAPALDVTENVTLGTDHTVRNTALRGQVVGRGGRPIAGAGVTTTVSGASSITRANGVWFLYFDLDQPDVNNVTVTVSTPDGATASDSSARVRHGATTVVPTFHSV